MKKILWPCFLATLTFGQAQLNEVKANKTEVSIIVLGTVQDGGSPHIGCAKECCSLLFEKPDPTRKVVSLGVVDVESNTSYLFEATPDITTQLNLLQKMSGSNVKTPNGIFLTHAHIGHYTGLMYLGREALNASKSIVYVMPRMMGFLEKNGPWSQLSNLQNIELHLMANEQKMVLTKNLSVVPFEVPHRDEFSETVGYKIIGPNKSALFIPDIDKWNKWDKDIVDEIKKVDYALLDATFFDGAEINNRDIGEIPHHFVVESLALFKNLSKPQKDKIHFIHFNHTNPLLQNDSPQLRAIQNKKFHIARFGQVFKL
ncbi:MAG: pyrroloquinoline quinone biosynthesis protein PqqB [Flavobacteriaceae bacterium]|nr:MAG: pyrroloquinoline quinone biosynthesis protein PqqB [Flavobacteriaceae bacterium]